MDIEKVLHVSLKKTKIQISVFNVCFLRLRKSTHNHDTYGTHLHWRTP